MDKLLEREYYLLESLDPYQTAFRYIPLAPGAKAKVFTSPSSRLIFEA